MRCVSMRSWWINCSAAQLTRLTNATRSCRRKPAGAALTFSFYPLSARGLRWKRVDLNCKWRSCRRENAQWHGMRDVCVLPADFDLVTLAPRPRCRAEPGNQAGHRLMAIHLHIVSLSKIRAHRTVKISAPPTAPLCNKSAVMHQV